VIEQGGEVVVPAGGLPMLLFAREREFTIDAKAPPEAISEFLNSQ
jgi:hypothetical protein